MRGIVRPASRQFNTRMIFSDSKIFMNKSVWSIDVIEEPAWQLSHQPRDGVERDDDCNFFSIFFRNQYRILVTIRERKLGAPT